MDILFVTHYSGMYGANKSLCALILELRNTHGIQPVVLLPRNGPICSYLKSEEIPFIISHFYWWVNEKSGLFQWLLNWRKQLINRFRVNKIVSLFAKYEFDLVYTNSVTINIGTMLVEKMGLPHVWHIRESMTSYRFKFSMGKTISRRFLIKGAVRYILISEYLKNSYNDLLPADKVKVVYNGVSIDEDQLERKNSIGEKIKLCVVGVICEQKNQMDAVQALEYLVNSEKVENIELHLVGSHKTDYLEKVKAFIKENRLEKYVILHGHTNDVHAVLRNMDIGLMCSRDEAFGRVTIEYMLHYMPVIASRSGANEELVSEGLNGALYQLYNSRELAEIILEYMENSKKIIPDGEAAHSFAKENFSMEKNAQRVAKIIYQLLNVSNRIRHY